MRSVESRVLPVYYFYTTGTGTCKCTVQYGTGTYRSTVQVQVPYSTVLYKRGRAWWRSRDVHPLCVMATYTEGLSLDIQAKMGVYAVDMLKVAVGIAVDWCITYVASA